MAGRANDSRSLAERMLAILDAFDRPGVTDLSLDAIAERSGLPRSTAHRLATALVRWGGLEHSRAGGYRLGIKLWRLGARQSTARTLRQIALPYLRDLHDLTGENVTLAIRDELAALYLERLAGPRSLAVVADLGRRLPLHATGVGLVLLAWENEAVVEAVVAAGLRRFLDNTLSTPEALRRRLAEVRRVGVATTRDEMTPGAASIAAPVRDARDRVVAAVSIIVPSDRPVDPRYELAVRLAALAVSRELAREAPAPG